MYIKTINIDLFNFPPQFPGRKPEGCSWFWNLLQ